MTLSVYDVAGNVASILLLLLIPVTARISNFLIDRAAAREGYNNRQKATIKRYATYSRDFSVLFTSLLFSSFNTVYLMVKDGLQWIYLVPGGILIALIIGLTVIHAILNPHSVTQPLSSYFFEDSRLFGLPLLRRLTPTHVFIFVSMTTYVIPTLLVLYQIGVVEY